MATTPPTTTRVTWWRVAAWAVPAVLAAVGTVGLALLHHHTTAGWTVLLGGADDAVLTIYAQTLISLGAGGLLLTLAATLRTRTPSPRRRFTAGRVTTAVMLGWVCGGAAAVWGWMRASQGWVHLDTPGTDERWAVQEIPALGDTTYGLYVTTTPPLYQRVARMTSPEVHTPFSDRQYRIEHDDHGHLVLRYPTVPDGPYDATVQLDP